MNFKTDRAKVLGLGSAKSGADHWFGERLKSVALIPLTIIFVLIIAPLIGSDHASVVASFENPLIDSLATIFPPIAAWIGIIKLCLGIKSFNFSQTCLPVD